MSELDVLEEAVCIAREAGRHCMCWYELPPRPCCACGHDPSYVDDPDLARDPLGEVYVRRQLLRGPRDFRYPWVSDQLAYLAWPAFEAEGWGVSEWDEGDYPYPPLEFIRVAPTSSPVWFIAHFDVAFNAWHEDGYHAQFGYVGRPDLRASIR